MMRNYRTNNDSRASSSCRTPSEVGARMQMQGTNCNNLKKKLQTLDFAIIDTVLFLDAYPKNAQALDYYHKLVNEREILAKAINESCGPIDSMSNKSRNEWAWVASPWPWEIEAN